MGFQLVFEHSLKYIEYVNLDYEVVKDFELEAWVEDQCDLNSLRTSSLPSSPPDTSELLVPLSLVKPE